MSERLPDRKSSATGKTGPAAEESTQMFSAREQRDPEFISDIRTTILVQSPRGGSLIVWATLLLFCLIFYWMYSSEIQEVTRGNGKVIPSSQLQVVQNLEGGILAEIYVKNGDVVQKGQLLMRLDETRFSAPYRQSRMKYLALMARAARLQAETEDTEMIVPEVIEKEGPEITARERQLYQSRQIGLSAKMEVLEEQVKQRNQELIELKGKLSELRRTYRLLKKEIDLTKPLIEQGAVSEVEVLRLERQASSMLGDISATRFTIPKVESMLSEAQMVIKEEKLRFRNSAKEELNEVEVELEGIAASEVALADRLDRTSVRSPVYGTVKQVLVNTVGGVVQPGMDLVEIVPLEDTLLIETQIQPSDIAFLRPKQKAMVKFTAYDYTIYGGLEAELEQISADSITDEQGRSYYLVRVRTKQNFLDGKNGPMPIIPGMVTSVDIVTGKKTILSYLLKPVLRAKYMALRER
ncbi:HlyD family type I secretion periplasmic adaptor subunit [Desulforhopalus singaporensis]|uniref:Membrane fusion protein, adhesin transport system n=1 Tax=Desulforhopalus singaporensis TaxID=91360 RepID=A0A1H0MX74_9BACT|nr:HlyD family type I secretion periplasmic adaptor subunit [Desulforhopalus singaporensis]SDO84876.1 membrane fusion protein, adhesin transport system [Desulforhopalus singaporensis]